MSGRRRRGEDEFAAEQPWLTEDDAGPWPPQDDGAGPWPPQDDGAGRWPPEDDDAGRWPPQDDGAGRWPPQDDVSWPGRPEQVSADGRRGRHSARPDPGGWEPSLTVPRQAGPHGQPASGTAPGWEEPGWEDPGREGRFALRHEPDPGNDPLERPPGRSGDAGSRYGGSRSRSDRAARYGDPGVQYGGPPGQHRDPPGRYGDPGGQYGEPGGQHGDPGGWDREPAGQYGVLSGQYGGSESWDRGPAGRDGVPEDRGAGVDGRYRDPDVPHGDPDDPGPRYGDHADRPGGRGRGYGDPGEWPDAPSGRRPGSRDRYTGGGDGYPPPDRGAPGARRAGPGGDEYRDEYGERPGRDEAAGAGGLFPGTPDGQPAGGGYAPRGRAGRSGRAATGYGGQDRDPAAYGPGDRDTARGLAAEQPGRRWADRDDQDDSQDSGWPFGGGAGDDDSRGRPRRKRRGRWAGPSSLLIVAAIILIPLIIGGLYAYRVISAHYDPPNYSGDGTGTVIFQVKPGDNSETVGVRLAADGVVASSRALVLAAEHSSNTNELEPGYYRLHKHMNAQLAWNLLLSPAARVQLKVTIPEGWRVSQIVTALGKLGKQSGIPASDYTKALKDTKALGLPSYAKGNPQGYLFPDTYEIQPHSTAISVLKAMVSAFNQEAASVNLPKAAAQGNLTPAEAIVVASLAQAEGGKDSDFPKITRVIYNRLAAHMRLDLDSTVLYALHTYGIVASSQQLKVKSPYNTYAHQGLPPGPIDSPGNAAIQAALHPAHGNWLYFVTVNPKTKQTDFTSSPAVFQQLKNELERNLAHGG